MPGLLLYFTLVGLFRCSEASTEFDVKSFLSSNLLRSSLTTYTPLQGNTHTPCNVSGNVGVCMYTWECVTAGGVPLGTCKENFIFGSCCFRPILVSALTRVELDDQGFLKPSSYGTHNCGMRSKLFMRKGHVLNGEDVKFGEFPWLVSIRRVSVLPKTIPWCGGTLLNQEWILTAAHCCHRVWPTNIIVRAGELDFKNPNKYFPYVERRVLDNISHPKYSKTRSGISDFDISLLRLEHPIRFQPHISPICLPGAKDILLGDKAIVAGWGKTESLKSSVVLKKFIAPILNSTECMAMFMEEGYNLELSNKVFCAGYAAGERDACQGDSGGPLQMKGKDGRFYVGGIVSTGIGCGKPNFPGLYLRVFPFLHWILETMSIESGSKF